MFLPRWVLWSLLAIFLALAGWGAWSALTFPTDRTPEGAYLRIAGAVNRDRPQDFFAYIDEEAQHACFTLLDYRRKARARIAEAYPAEKRAQALRPFEELAALPSASDVFAHYARTEGWLSQLRRDLSAIEKVESAGPRATVVTAAGTRYALRRRPNGIYGMSAFTPFLREEAERAARDFGLIDRTARDYEAAQRR